MPKQFFSALFTRRMLRNLFLGGLLFASGASVLSSGCSTTQSSATLSGGVECSPIVP